MQENVTIEITRNSLKIYPYYWNKWNKETKTAEGTCPALDKSLMIFDKRFHHYKLTIDIYDKKSHILTLPIGIGKEYVEEKLYNANVLYTEIDKFNQYPEPREVLVNLKEDLTIRDKYQAQSIDFLTTNELFHIKMLALYTGRGKTFCAISAAFRLKVPALIVSPTLKDQWLEKLVLYTNCTIDNGGIVQIDSSVKLDKLLSKGKEKNLAAFYLTTPTLLTSHIDKYGTLDDVIDTLGLGILCFDEFHTFYSQNIKISSVANIKYTFYLTATPGRSNYGENAIFKKLMKDIPVYGLDTFNVGNYFNIRYVNYNTMPTEYEIQSCITSKGLSGVLYWNYIFRDYKKRMYMLTMIKMLLDKLLEEDPNIKVLIYLAKKEHIRSFMTILEKMYNNTDLKFGNYTTDIEKRYKRREIKNNIIFTTIGSGGVGLDADNLRASLVLIPISSSITVSQMLGRLREIPGKEVYYYDFVDDGFRTMEHQRNARNAILAKKAKSSGYKTITMEMATKYLQV